MSEYVYDIQVNGVSKAFCCSWDAKQAALRLLFGTFLVLPPTVVIVQTKRAN